MNHSNNSGLLLYKRLLKRTKIYKTVFILAVIGMIIHAIADTSFAALIKPLLDGSFIEPVSYTHLTLPTKVRV